MSGIFFSGLPARLLSLWGAERFTSVVTVAILDEYEATFQKLIAKIPAGARSRAGRDFLEAFVLKSLLIEDLPLATSLCRDPDDDKFLTCAAAARAVIASGDRDLLDGSPWQVLSSRVEVLTPRQAVSMLEAKND